MSPTITLPARKFLERFILNRYRNSQPFVALDIEDDFDLAIVNWIAANDPTVTLAVPSPDIIHHGEWLAITIGGAPNIRCVWIASEWRADNERQLHLKQVAEQERQANAKRRIASNSILTKFCAAFGFKNTDNDIREFANTLWDTKENPATVKLLSAMGITVQELEEMTKD